MTSIKSSSNIVIATDSDGRWKAHTPFTGPDSEHKLVYGSELDKICNFHKEIIEARTNFRDFWLGLFLLILGYFLSNGLNSFNGQKTTFDAVALTIAIFSGALFLIEFRKERKCIESREMEIKGIREQINNRQVQNIEPQMPKNQTGKHKGRAGK